MKLVKLVGLFDPQTGEHLGGMLAKTDQLLSFNSLAITGGEELRITLRSNLAMYAGGFWTSIR